MKLCPGNRVTWFDPETEEDRKAEVLLVRVKKVQILTVDFQKHWAFIEDVTLEPLPVKTIGQALAESSITNPVVEAANVSEGSITFDIGDRVKSNRGQIGEVIEVYDKGVIVAWDEGSKEACMLSWLTPLPSQSSITIPVVEADNPSESSITNFAIGDRVINDEGIKGTIITSQNNEWFKVSWDDGDVTYAIPKLIKLVIEPDILSESSITQPVIEPDDLPYYERGDRVQHCENESQGTVLEMGGHDFVEILWDSGDVSYQHKKFLLSVIEPDESSITHPVIERDIPSESSITKPVIEPYPVTLGTYLAKNHTYWRISYREGKRVKHHHVTEKKVGIIQNAIAIKMSRAEILAILKGGKSR